VTRLEDITIFNDIRERLELITDEQIGMVSNRMQEPVAEGEIPVGIVDRSTRALWTLTVVLAGEVALESARSVALIDDALIADHTQRMLIAEQILEVTKNLMWAQARSDLGFWKKSSIGIRKEWLLVEVPESNSPLEKLLKGLKLGL
jgi:hypothetical protein